MMLKKYSESAFKKKQDICMKIRCEDNNTNFSIFFISIEYHDQEESLKFTCP